MRQLFLLSAFLSSRYNKYTRMGLMEWWNEVLWIKHVPMQYVKQQVMFE